jgi:glycosyltransferase involved in cell wall biosynthesis
LALSDPHTSSGSPAPDTSTTATGATQPVRSLRILIDAYNRDLEHGTGISTYSRQLARALTALGHKTHWLFARETPKGADALTGEVTFFDRPAPLSRVGRVTHLLKRVSQGFFGSTRIDAQLIRDGGTVVIDPERPHEANAYNASGLYERAHYKHLLRGKFTGVSLHDPMDVFHLTAPLPVKVKSNKTIKTVATIHDLIPLRLPYTTLDNKREIIRRLRTTVELADQIITVSESSKNDIVNILGVDPDRISVTYQTSDLAPFRPSEHSALPRVLSRYGLEHKRYALFVSAIEPKKNLRRLIEAFLEVDSPLPLVIVGKKAWMWENEIGNIETVFGARALRRLRFLGYVPRVDLRYLYAGANFLAFPSLYEGFGLPALEAMQFGCPVLTSNISSLPEICGEAALYVDPFDRDDMREKIERMLNEPELRTWLTEAGREQAGKFTFDAYVQRLGAAYGKLPE